MTRAPTEDLTNTFVGDEAQSAWFFNAAKIVSAHAAPFELAL